MMLDSMMLSSYNERTTQENVLIKNQKRIFRPAGIDGRRHSQSGVCASVHCTYLF